MRKAVILGLVLALSMVVFVVTPVFAQPRTNVWASWTNVANTQITWTFPYDSRDLIIQNGSTETVCVSLRGNTINADADGDGDRCTCDATDDCVQLDGDCEISLYDFVTNSVSFLAAGSDASPITVIVTY